MDRIQIAQKVLTDPHRGELVWAWGGFVMLLGEIQAKLADHDPHIRGDATIALTDFGRHARHIVPILLDQLRSPESTLHDKTLAAWALPSIGAAADEAVPVLLAILDCSSEHVLARSSSGIGGADFVRDFDHGFGFLLDEQEKRLAGVQGRQ